MKYQHLNQRMNSFIQTMEEMYQKMMQLQDIWYQLNVDENVKTALDYPFDKSFDELTFDVGNWITTVKVEFGVENVKFYPTVTVGELFDILSSLDRDTQISIDDSRGWYKNINEIELPNDDKGIVTLTLHSKTDFRPEQV